MQNNLILKDAKLLELTQQAEQAYQQNDLTMAQDYCEQVLAQAPLNEAALIIQINIWLKQKQYKKAETLCQQILQTHPNNLQFLRLQILTRKTQNPGDPELEQYCTKLLQILPDDVDSLLCRGYCLAANGNLDNALPDLNRAYELAPDNLEVCENYVRVHLATKYDQSLISICDYMIAKQPANSEYRDLRAEVNSGSHNYDAVERDCAMALAINPENDKALNTILIERRKQNTNDLSLPILSDKLLKLKPYNILYWNNAIKLNYFNRNFAKAKEYCIKALTILPDHLEILLVQIFISSHLDDYPLMEATCNRVLSLEREQPDILLKRAYARFKQKNYQGAFDDLHLLLELKADDVEILDVYVDYYLALTDKQLIARYATKAKQASAELSSRFSTEAGYTLKQIEICNLMQDYQAMLELSQDLLRAEPGNVTANYWQSRAWFSLGNYEETLKTQRQLDDVHAKQLRDFYTEQLNKTGIHYHTLYLRTELHVQAQNYQKALKDCDRLLAQNSIDVVVLMLKLTCLTQTKSMDDDYRNITTLCQSLLKLAPDNKVVLETIAQLGGLDYTLVSQVYALLRQLEPENGAYLKASLPVRLGLGAYQNLLADCNTLLNKNPDDQETRLWRAKFWFKQADYSNALRDCETILRAQPNHAEAGFWQTICFQAMGRYADHTQHKASFLQNIARLFNNGRYQAVLSDCDLLLKLDPANITALEYQAHSAFKLALDETTEQTCLQLLKFQNKEDYLLWLFSAQFNLGKYKAIIDHCDELLTDGKYKVSVKLYRAKALFATSQYEEAINHCKEILQAEAFSIYKKKALLTLVEGLLKQGDLQAIVKMQKFYWHHNKEFANELLNYYNKNLIKNHNDTSLLWLRAKLRLLQYQDISKSKIISSNIKLSLTNKAERILADYAKLLALRLDNKDVLEFGLECADFSDARKVLIICDRLLLDEPTHLLALQTKAKFEFQLKNYPTVIQTCLELLKLEKRDDQPSNDKVRLTNTLFALGYLTAAKFYLGEYQEVIRMCNLVWPFIDEIDSLSEDDDDVWYIGRNDNWLDNDIAEPVDSDWQDRRAFSSYLTKALVKLEQWEQALNSQKFSQFRELYDYYTELLATQSNHDKLLWLRANIAIQTKESEYYLDAVKDCDKLCAMQSDEARLLGLSTKIKLCQQYGLPQKPLAQLYQEVLTISPHHNESLLFLANFYYKKGDYKQAISYCENILSHNKEGYFAAAELLAEIYYKQTQYEKAAQVWRQLEHNLDEEMTNAQRLKIARHCYAQANYAHVLKICEHILQNEFIIQAKELHQNALFLQGYYLTTRNQFPQTEQQQLEGSMAQGIQNAFRLAFSNSTPPLTRVISDFSYLESNQIKLLNIFISTQPKTYLKNNFCEISDIVSELLNAKQFDFKPYVPIIIIRYAYALQFSPKQQDNTEQLVKYYEFSKNIFEESLNLYSQFNQYNSHLTYLQLGLAVSYLALSKYAMNEQDRQNYCIMARQQFQSLQKIVEVEPWVIVGGLLLCDYHQNPNKLNELQTDMLIVWNSFINTLKQGETDNQAMELITKMTLKLFIVQELLPLLSMANHDINFNFARSNRLLPEQVWTLSQVINKHQIKCINYHNFKLQHYLDDNLKFSLFNKKINRTYTDITIYTQDSPQYSP